MGVTSVERAQTPSGPLARLRGRRVSDRAWVGLCVLLVVAVRLPFLTLHVGADEGGFLLLGSQWRSGAGSLYGQYWVDRPPLLIGAYGLADALGGVVALRLIGCVAAGATVLLAAHAGRTARGAAGGRWAAMAAGAFLTTSMFGAPEVSGELLAVPFVMASVAVTLSVIGTRDPRRQLLGGLLAGALAAVGPLVKQNFVDGFVFAVVALAVAALTGRIDRRAAGRALAGGVVGALVTAAVVLAWAASRGTSLPELWNALIPFRADAAAVISSSASPATGERLVRLVGSFVISGGAVLATLALISVVRRRGRDHVGTGAVAVLGWATFSVFAGGSYWLHYLLEMLPGLALAAAIAGGGVRRTRRVGRPVVVYALLLAVVAGTTSSITRIQEGSVPYTAGTWLGAASRPGDTAIVAYGQPGILYEAGLSSPYSMVWSLPVRVRDPRLTQMTAVLEGPRAPVWLVQWRGTMRSWGIDPSAAEPVIEARYRRVADVCGYAVLLRDDVERPVPPTPAVCPSGP
ncbi:hypothetical protein [Solicola sp. PLA-1-18]|uniref:hypothetical protein n=1 Tax=Solicola sp. PLA-1-18 TaxID=3380532 RepID=UPI003B76C4D3